MTDPGQNTRDQSALLPVSWVWRLLKLLADAGAAAERVAVLRRAVESGAVDVSDLGR